MARLFYGTRSISVALQKEYVAKLIIINDGLTDNTARVIKDFSIAHPDIAVLTKHQENQADATSSHQYFKTTP